MGSLFNSGTDRGRRENSAWRNLAENVTLKEVDE